MQNAGPTWSNDKIAESVAQQFLNYSIWQLRDYNFPKIREAVLLLDDQELWQRPGKTSNSIGNLLLHLAGNVRQHIISGAGGVADIRDRPAEFAATEGATRDQSLDLLEKTIHEACAVLEAFDPEKLLERRVIQGMNVVIFDDIYHVVEHFSYHTGQIIAFVKQQKEHRFDWYAKFETKVK